MHRNRKRHIIKNIPFMKQATFTVSLLFLLVPFAKSQNKHNNELATFNWHSGLCTHTGSYNPKKHTKEQLQNTLEFIQLSGSVLLNTDATAFQPGDIQKLSIEKLEEEYTKKKGNYQKKIVVAEPIWENLKKQIIQALDEEYELKKITIQAFSNPNTLLNSKFAPYCSDYVKALTSFDTTTLLNSWKKMSVAHSKNNANPKKFMEDFMLKYNSTDKMSYAKIELMTFGWWNCANSRIFHVSATEGRVKKFNQLFINIKSDCEEP